MFTEAVLGPLLCHLPWFWHPTIEGALFSVPSTHRDTGSVYHGEKQVGIKALHSVICCHKAMLYWSHDESIVPLYEGWIDGWTITWEGLTLSEYFIYPLIYSLFICL